MKVAFANPWVYGHQSKLPGHIGEAYSEKPPRDQLYFWGKAAENKTSSGIFFCCQYNYSNEVP